MSKYRDLLEGQLTGLLTTIGPDGPNAAPVWFVFDGECLLVSTRAATQKHRNITRDPRASFTLVDPANTMRYLELRGEAEVAIDETYETRERVVHKHGFASGASFDPPGTRRITIRIRPTRVIAH